MPLFARLEEDLSIAGSDDGDLAVADVGDVKQWSCAVLLLVAVEQRCCGCCRAEPVFGRCSGFFVGVL